MSTGTSTAKGEHPARCDDDGDHCASRSALVLAFTDKSHAWRVFEVFEEHDVVPVGSDVGMITRSTVTRAPTAFPPHATPIVVSDTVKAIYVVNLKAASTSLEGWMMQYAGGQHKCRPLPTWLPNSSCCVWPDGVGRLTTRCLTDAHQDHFFFTFARDPVDKFETGVRQAWQLQGHLRTQSADDLLLNGALLSPALRARDKHLEPNNYWLSGVLGDGSTPVRIDFIGHTESFERDWSLLLSTWPLLNVTNASGGVTPPPAVANQRHMAPPDHHLQFNLTSEKVACPKMVDSTFRCMSYLEHAHGSRLSPTAICAMCRSYRYGSEFSWLNYSSRCAPGCASPLAEPSLGAAAEKRPLAVRLAAFLRNATLEVNGTAAML